MLRDRRGFNRGQTGHSHEECKRPSPGSREQNRVPALGEGEAGSCCSLGVRVRERWQGTRVPNTSKPANRLDRTLSVINHNSF